MGGVWTRARLGITIIAFELLFLILFGVFVRYDELAMPRLAASPAATSSNHSAADHQPAQSARSHVAQFYSMFQDIHVMMFIGFGFLMTFLKRYGFSSVGLNFLVAAFVLQWATLTGGWIRHFDYATTSIHIDLPTLIDADFASAAVLISFGAVLGKVSPLQLLIMAFLEILVFQVNELIVFHLFKATDIGDSMVVHVFGAYFGLAVARVIYTDDVHHAEDKEASVYHSDLFSIIGTLFLWLFWPSFNSGIAVDEGQLRAIINTYYSLTASVLVTFAVSSLISKSKFNMVHIQNSTLAGGVAIGTLADLIIQPWAALLVGGIAGAVSVIGFHLVTPLLTRLKVHDTCGVHNLHGLPGVISGIGGIVAAALATPARYGDGLTKIFTQEGRTAGQLAGFQAAALVVSFALSIVGGILTGLVLLLPVWDQPRQQYVFDDQHYWLLPPAAVTSPELVTQTDGVAMALQSKASPPVATTALDGKQQQQQGEDENKNSI